MNDCMLLEGERCTADDCSQLPHFIGHRSERDGRIDVLNKANRKLFTALLLCTFEELGERLGCPAIHDSGIFVFDSWNGQFSEPRPSEWKEYSYRLVTLFSLIKIE